MVLVSFLERIFLSRNDLKCLSVVLDSVNHSTLLPHYPKYSVAYHLPTFISNIEAKLYSRIRNANQWPPQMKFGREDFQVPIMSFGDDSLYFS